MKLYFSPGACSLWVGIDLAKWTVLKDYHARVAARPKVQEALKTEGLIK